MNSRVLEIDMPENKPQLTFEEIHYIKGRILRVPHENNIF